MPPPPAISFQLCGETYATRDSLWNAARVINWYPSIDASGVAQSKIELAPIPGLTTFTTLTNPPVRGLWSGDNRLFAVAQGDLFEISSAGAATTISGGVLSAATPVQFAANGTSLLIASGDSIWYATTTSSKVKDGAISCVYLDGYYIILWSDGQTIQISTDGLTWDPLDIAQSIGPVDRKVRLEAHEGHLWMFGTRSISVWYDSGNADFPFAPIDGATINQGTLAPWSVARIDRTLYWLGMDEHGYGRVFRSE